jgi:hypothetical protein
MKTLVSFMKRTVAQKHTLLRSKLKFMIIIWTKMRPTRTAKHLKKGVVRCFFEKTLKRSFHIDGATRKPVDEETGSSKSIALVA